MCARTIQIYLSICKSSFAIKQIFSGHLLPVHLNEMLYSTTRPPYLILRMFVLEGKCNRIRKDGSTYVGNAVDAITGVDETLSCEERKKINF